MITDSEILALIREEKKQFGCKCGKYAGALTIEVIRSALKTIPVNVSPRDSFIRGVAIEFDLMIVADGVSPAHNVLYRPKDVLAVVEIKNYGSFGDRTIQKVRADFETASRACPNLTCMYVTLVEREGFRWAVTRKNTGYPAYTLFSHRGENFWSTGDWRRFLGDVGRLSQEARTVIPLRFIPAGDGHVRVDFGIPLHPLLRTNETWPNPLKTWRE